MRETDNRRRPGRSARQRSREPGRAAADPSYHRAPTSRWSPGRRAPKERASAHPEPVFDDSRGGRYLPDVPGDAARGAAPGRGNPQESDLSAELGYGDDWPPERVGPPAYRPTEPGAAAYADDQYPFGYGPYRPRGGHGTGFRSGAERPPGRAYPRGPKGYVRSDARIREDLCDRLLGSFELDSSEVTVEVSHGVVTLSGTVPERRMKHAIEDLAAGCAGVEDVENRIRLARGGESRP